jgi:hypothetical protein
MTMKRRATSLLRHFHRGLSSLALGIALACSHGQSSRMPGGEITGQVTQRAEGYSERPDWADANRPWSRQGDSIRLVGYVAIRGDQRMETGYRAADSYARAELVRFLSVRVVSVLEDQVTTGEPQALREHIEVTAQSWVDDLAVAQRYFERRKTGDEEKIHIWSRLDVDQAAIVELLQRSTKDAADLRTPVANLINKLKERWERFADVGSLNQGDPLLPADVSRPPWAKTGDRTSDTGFEFVCHGLAKDEKTARALAQARCNEKLCRLFGVQISAKTKVVENLDGVTAESEVSEQCANVRVVGRETRYQGGECGPHGCVQWILQNYPRAAFEEEKLRLDKPTVIQQQVVIQEGSKLYRDPAACEASLRAYGAVKGQDATAFEQRRQPLQRAMQVCQGIDGRDSGLFTSLNNLLTTPLSTFSVESDLRNDRPVNVRFAFTIATPEWRKDLETKRFLTDRIAAVLKLVADAVVPLRLLDIRDHGGNDSTVDVAMREVVKYPFVHESASPHHSYNVHYLALSLAREKRRQIAYSPRYRLYLLEQAEKGRVTCGERTSVSGSDVIEYLAADGQLDDREWQAGLRLMRNSPIDVGRGCFAPLWNNVNHGGLRAQRIDQSAQMITSGEVKAKDTTEMFEQFISVLEPAERASLFLRYRSKLTGSDQSRAALLHEVLSSSFRWNWEWKDKRKDEGRAQCESMPNRIGTLFADNPEAKTKDTGLCLCLSLEGLSPTARKAIGELLFRYAEEPCNAIRPEDWPEEYYKVAEPEYLSVPDPPPFGPHVNFLKTEFKQCLASNSLLERSNVVTYLTFTLTSGRYSNAKADSKLVGELNRLTYRDKRRGFVHASDVLGMLRNIESCMRDAANRFQVPPAFDIVKERRPQRMWCQYWDENPGACGFAK